MAATALNTHQVEEPENEYRKGAEQSTQLNYIQLINRFWQMHEEHCFTGNEIALYFYLLKSCNALGWKQSFKHSNGYISGVLAISEKTLITCRNKLKQAGLVDFDSGNGRRGITAYDIKAVIKAVKFTAFREETGKPFGHPFGENTPHNNKHKLNKTNSSSAPSFAKPSLEEVANYMRQKNQPFPDNEAGKFIDYYSANGWKVGKNPMKDWQASVRNWIRNNNPQGQTQHRKPTNIKPEEKDSLWV